MTIVTIVSGLKRKRKRKKKRKRKERLRRKMTLTTVYSISGPEDGEVSTHDIEPGGDSEDFCLPPLMSSVRQKSEGKETLKKQIFQNNLNKNCHSATEWSSNKRGKSFASSESLTQRNLRPGKRSDSRTSSSRFTINLF